MFAVTLLMNIREKEKMMEKIECLGCGEKYSLSEIDFEEKGVYNISDDGSAIFEFSFVCGICGERSSYALDIKIDIKV